MTVKRMDNVVSFVEDIGVAIDLFIELCLEVEGRVGATNDAGTRRSTCEI